MLKFARPIANWSDNESGELALDKTQVYAITAEDENGWCTGVNVQTGEIGSLIDVVNCISFNSNTGIIPTHLVKVDDNYGERHRDQLYTQGFPHILVDCHGVQITRIRLLIMTFLRSG